MGSIDHAKTELLDFSTWQWKDSLPNLNYAEIYSFAVTFYRNEFYVVGGRTKNAILSVVSTFNPRKQEWSQIGNLIFPRFDHKIEVIGEKLYIIGGSKTFEYCDLLNGFECSVLTDATIEPNDNVRLYGFYPSKCKPGTFKLKLSILPVHTFINVDSQRK